MNLFNWKDFNGDILIGNSNAFGSEIKVEKDRAAYKRKWYREKLVKGVKLKKTMSYGA